MLTLSLPIVLLGCGIAIASCVRCLRIEFAEGGPRAFFALAIASAWLLYCANLLWRLLS